MYFLQDEVEPMEGSPNAERFGGAIVNCWIRRESKAEAERLAREMIQGEQWRILELKEAEPKTRVEQVRDGLQCFDQAEVDGPVLVFNTWPIGSPESS